MENITKKMQLEWLERYDSLNAAEKASLHSQLLKEQDKNVVQKIHTRANGREDLLTDLVFAANSAQGASEFFRLGYSLHILEVAHYLERSIQEERTQITALLLDYKGKTFTEEQWDNYEMRKDYLDMGLCEPTLGEFGLNWAYNQLSPKEIVLNRYIGTETTVRVPAVVDGCRVVTLHSNHGMIRGLFPVTRLELEDGILLSGMNLFNGDPLEEIVLGKGMTVIPHFCFQGCPLKELEIPEGVERIEMGVGQYCKKLETLILPQSLCSIGEYAFAHTMLETLVLPNSLKKIEGSSFGLCPQLKELTLGAGPLTVRGRCFWACKQLETVFLTGRWNVKLDKSGEWRGAYSSIFKNCPNLRFIGTKGGENQLDHLREIDALAEEEP